ncbi:MAG: hypothetical protein HY813_02915 [Candidatus Portnoybacteria bacterium]|nr:hypothetical protein [Candidatus Portnoybacteria bacterium]
MKYRMIVSMACVFLFTASLFGCAGLPATTGGTTIPPVTPLTPVAKKTTVSERYGENIFYKNFSDITQKLIPGQLIEVPVDLAEYFIARSPKVADLKRFEKEFWEEAGELGYTKQELQTADAPEVIMAIVETVASRITYFNVDGDKNFKARYGKDLLQMDTYFHLKLGDCDKYRDITIALYGIIKNSFDVVKKRNPNLTNVYLSVEKLGGIIRNHAWVTIVILREDSLIISQIDPTFYDSTDVLEAENGYHIILDQNAFRAYFYQGLGDKNIENFSLSYRIFKKVYAGMTNKKIMDELLRGASFGAVRLAYYYPQEAIAEISWINEQYQAKNFRRYLDTLLYRSYKIYSRAGYKQTAEMYKKTLLKEFPKSFWVGQIKIDEKKDEKK